MRIRRKQSSKTGVSLEEAPFAVVDVETTGFSPKLHDRVVEIAVVRIDRTGAVLGEYSTLVNPERDVGPTNIHGITATDVLNAPRFAQVLGNVAELLRDAVLVAHNARFDTTFLTSEFSLAGHSFPEIPTLCTLRLAYALEATAPRRRLGDCCERWNISLSAPHSAHENAKATAALLIQYLELARQRGDTDLERLGCRPLLFPSSWPSVAVSGSAVSRAAAREAARTEVPYLADLVARLELTDVHDADIAVYLDLLNRALEDRQLSDHEGETLFAVAKEWGLSRDSVLDAHRLYLRALVDAALADARISTSERRDLELVCRLLGFQPDVLDGLLLERAWTADPPQRTTDSLRGLTVCFTGTLRGNLDGEPIARELAQDLARRAGLVPVPSVTRRLDLLVVSDPNSMSGKAKKARAMGTRIIAESAFWNMLGIQVD